MKRKQTLFAAGGILFLIVGAAIIFSPSRRYSEHRYVTDAGACRLQLSVVQRADLPEGTDPGSVVLLHGISANRVIMTYLARSFAELGLRVYLPDLPGHGKSTGAFSPAQAEACSLSLVRGLAARGMIHPDRTILSGHSMGGAIALRIAGRVRPAGVIAISPAPMQTAHGVQSENLLYQDPPVVPPNTLILAGQFEPEGLAGNAADLAATSTDSSVKFERLQWNSHVSVLFSPQAALESQKWAARLLDLPNSSRLPSRAYLLGGVLGLAGILLLAGPFIREMVGKEQRDEKQSVHLPSALRTATEFAGVSIAAVYLLRYWQPLRLLHIFEGDYLAGFFLIVGMALLLLHPRLAQSQFLTKPAALLGAAVAAVIVHLLITGWFELSVTSSWMTLQRWARFPVYFLAAFLFLYALEILLGPNKDSRGRLIFSLLLLTIAWLGLVGGVLYLRSGEVLLVLLLPYFVLFFLLSRLGSQLVRQQTASATAAAVFGAILLAGFCLVLFPAT